MLRQRALESQGAWWAPWRARWPAAALGFVFAAGAPAAEPARPDPAADGSGSVTSEATVAVGYAFRAVDSVEDDRAHGGAAVVGVDVGPVAHGFGARIEAVAFGFPAREIVTQPLALVAGGPTLTYAFDDTDVLAVARLGILGGAVVDGRVVSPALGGDVGLLLRFRAGNASHVDADVVVPLLPGDARFGLQAAATLGVGISLDRLVVGLARGEDAGALLLPTF